MSLDTMIRKGVAIANKVTAKPQVAVLHHPWTSDDEYSKPVYGQPIVRKAIVEMGPKIMRTTAGAEIVAVASVTIIGPIEMELSAGRVEPIDMRDKIELPNGQVGKVLNVNGMVDPLTGMPYMFEVAIS